MNKYIGLTIGPIVKTINYANSTGELWGSSYIFSYINKKIILRLIGDEKNSGIIDPKNFIVPNVEDNMDLLRTGNKAGLFHDRIIFKSDEKIDNTDSETVFDKLEKVINSVKEELALDIYNELEDKACAEEVKKFIKSYIKIYYLEVEVDKEDSIITKVSKYLDTLEIREKYVECEKENYIFKMFRNGGYKGTIKNNTKNTFLTKDAFCEDGKEKAFVALKKELYPSIMRIASAELDIPKDNKYNDDEILKEYIKDNKEKFKVKVKKYHEYVAIVQVDGDFMGTLIGELKSLNKCKEFSNDLIKYSKESIEVINEYGGFPIYAGGDDLLFIAPLKNSTIKNSDIKDIFQLLKAIDESFNKKFKKYKEYANVSISIGMEVFNQKYPLYFAVEDVRNLLFKKAKKFKYKNDEKNALSFNVIKSSGESFGATLRKDGQVYEKVIELFEKYTRDISGNEFKDILNQIHIKLFDDSIILNNIGKDEELINNYFANNFDEDIHGEEKIRFFIQDIKELVLKMYNEYEGNNIVINNVHAIMKFIRFMNEKLEYIEESGEKNE